MGKAPDDFDRAKPCNYLLGWIPSNNEYGGYWEKSCPALLTHDEGVTVMERGWPPYTKFLPVSPMEFNVLGMPLDKKASVYFDTDRQREVSLRSNSGKRKATYTEVMDRITDPEGK